MRRDVGKKQCWVTPQDDRNRVGDFGVESRLWTLEELVDQTSR